MLIRKMIQDPVGIPACFSTGDKLDDYGTVTKTGQSIFMSVYMTNIADQWRMITVTWCKHLLLHGLSVSVDGLETENTWRGGSTYPSLYTCKVELKPWNFWRKQGSKSFVVDGKPIDVFWDLKAAKFHGKTEPISEYYVAVVYGEEVVLVLGDMKKDAYRKTGCRPALTDPVLISRKEHVFGKKKFQTRIKFHENDGFHDILIECKNINRKKSERHQLTPPHATSPTVNLRKLNQNKNINNENGVSDLDMEIRIDGDLMIHVKHLQWKFRGNELIHFKKVKIEVYWDVHDWLFSPGLRHAVFIIKPLSSSLAPSLPMPLSVSSSPAEICGLVEGFDPICAFEFCLFLYAWKVE